MRVFKRVAVIGMMAGLIIGPVASTTSASAAPLQTRAPQGTHQLRLTGGHTSVTTAPGIAAALLGHGIEPIQHTRPRHRASCPVTGAVRQGSVRADASGRQRAITPPFLRRRNRPRPAARRLIPQESHGRNGTLRYACWRVKGTENSR